MREAEKGVEILEKKLLPVRVRDICERYRDESITYLSILRWETEESKTKRQAAWQR